MSFKNFLAIFLWGFCSIFSNFVFKKAIKETNMNIYFAGFALTGISMIFNIIRFIIIGETFDVAYLRKREILQVSILMIIERSIINFMAQHFSIKILFWSKTISPIYSLLYKFYRGDYVSIHKTAGTMIVAILSFQLTFSRQMEYTSCMFALFAAFMSCIRVTILKNTIENESVEKVHFAISIISTLSFGVISLIIGGDDQPIMNTELIISAILIWIASISSYKVLSFVEKITYDLIKNTWKIVGVLVSFFILHNTITREYNW